MKPAIAIFDLDGTLARTTAVGSSCFVEAVRTEFGITPNSAWSAYEHCTDDGIASEALSGHFGRPPLRSEIERLKARFGLLLAHAASQTQDAFAPVPGAIPLLHYLFDAGRADGAATRPALPRRRVR